MNNYEKEAFQYKHPISLKDIEDALEFVKGKHLWFEQTWEETGGPGYDGCEGECLDYDIDNFAEDTFLVNLTIGCIGIFSKKEVKNHTYTFCLDANNYMTKGPNPSCDKSGNTYFKFEPIKDCEIYTAFWTADCPK